MENSELTSHDSSIEELIALICTLRGANGCPWDKKQTPKTMIVYLIEEVYELADAIESGNSSEIREELGDVLFHIFFMAQMFQESGRFQIYDVARQIIDKMKRRHPHVFGDQKVNSSDDVIDNWQKIKRKEKKGSDSASVLDSVPAKLPALMRAYLISERAARNAYKEDGPSALLVKLEKQMDEFKVAWTEKRGDPLTHLLGDMIFSLVNLARLAKIHPETALTKTIRGFEKRFRQMQMDGMLSESGRTLESVPEK